MTYLAPAAPVDTVLIENYAADAVPLVVVLPVPTDTVVVTFDFSPATPGGDVSAGALAALEAEVVALQAAVSGVNTALAGLAGGLDASLSGIGDQIAAAAGAAVAQAEAASALAIAAVQDVVTANQTAVSQAQAAASSALAQLGAVATTITSMQSAIGANASSLTVQAAALTGLSQSLSGQITALQTAFDGNQASVTASLGSLATAQNALSTAQTDLASQVAGNAATAAQGLTTEVTARQALSDSFTSLQSSASASFASVNDSLSTLTTQQMASAASLSSLSASLGTTNATVTQNAAAAASATQAVAGLLNTLTSNYNASTAGFTSQIGTLTSQGNATASLADTLSASVAGGAGGGNDLANSELNGFDGWTTSFGVAGTILGLNLPGYSVPGTVNVLYAAIPGTPGLNNVADWISPVIPTSPNVRYEMSVLAAYHRAAYAQVFLEWIDAAGAHIAYSYETPYGTATGGVSDGAGSGTLSTFAQIGCFASSPANAAVRRLWLRLVTDGTEASPYGFFTHPLTRVASLGQTALSPYSPGTQANVPAINAAISNVSIVAASNTGVVATSLANLQAAYNQQVTSFDSAITLLNDAQGATATNVSTLSTTLNGHTATLSQYGASINGLLANITLAVSVDGSTGFVSLQGAKLPDGSVSTKFIINANTTEIHGNVLVDGTVTQGALTTQAVGSLKSPHNTVTLESGNGIWIVPPGIFWLEVELWGGGSGGTFVSRGSAGQVAATGGSGGGYSRMSIAVNPGDSINYVVGSGGAGAATSSSYTASSQGGTSSFGPHLSATGGYSLANFHTDGGTNESGGFTDFYNAGGSSGGQGSGGSFSRPGGAGPVGTGPYAIGGGGFQTAPSLFGNGNSPAGGGSGSPASPGSGANGIINISY